MQTQSTNKKLLIAGKSLSGKTSIHSIIFGTQPVKETDISTSDNQLLSPPKFMGKFSVYVWESNINRRSENMLLLLQIKPLFEDPEVLIYVFDISTSQGEEDMEEYKRCLTQIKINEKKIPIFCLVHKMDMLKDEEKDKIYEKKREIILKVTSSLSLETKGVFPTSIWHDTLYKAFSEIMQSLMPNLRIYKETVKQIVDATDYDEIVLFDKQTFLTIYHYERKSKQSLEEYERVSTTIKQFKLSWYLYIIKYGTDINSLQIKNSKFLALISKFDENTYIMVISFDPKIEPTATELSLSAVRRCFQKKQEEFLSQPEIKSNN